MTTFEDTFDRHEIRSSIVQENFGTWLLMRRHPPERAGEDGGFTKTATQTREELLRKALGLSLWRETLRPADAVARTLGATTSKAITDEPVH